MLSVQRLRVLREVIGHGSFSEAASALNYTQSAVSQAIATLEAEAGVPLLERDRRGVRPTTAGERLAEHAGRILTQLDAAEAELGAIAGIEGGELRMASFPTAGATLMPLAIAAFRSRLPQGCPQPGRGRAGGADAAAARRRVRPGPDLRVRGHRRARPGPAQRTAVPRSDEAGAAEGPSAGAQAADRARGPLRSVLGADLGGERLRPPRGQDLPGSGLRATRLLRVRRLPHGPGPGRGWRRRRR